MYFWKNGKTENRHLSNAHTRYRQIETHLSTYSTYCVHSWHDYVCVCRTLQHFQTSYHTCFLPTGTLAPPLVEEPHSACHHPTGRKAALSYSVTLIQEASGRSGTGGTKHDIHIRGSQSMKSHNQSSCSTPPLRPPPRFPTKQYGSSHGR